ncbi:MAG TPA: serine hydrolase domain-containing protein [Verrucomicrobiae bacterium]|nr:serine hydrolase domain-containing protein [Verrucomicrobiae bacterium]
MKTLLLKIVSILTVAAFLFTPVAKAQDTSILTDYVHNQFSTSGVRTGAVVITRDDNITELITVGDGVSGSTAFGLGSISKSFTALAIMQLYDKGLISLEAPVQTYVPEFRLADTTATSKITVRQLLNQTSGLPTQAGYLGLYNRSISLAGSLKTLNEVELVSEPGKEFNYSNSNYTILGLIIERVAGVSYGDYMQEHIFAPLAMSHTFTDTRIAKNNGMAKGYTNWFGLKIPFEDTLAPAVIPEGGIISSAEDMSHYMIALLNDGVFRGTRILSSSSIAHLLAPTVNTPNISMLNVNAYAMGWGVGTIGNTKIISHDGDTQNFHANIGLLPEEKKGIAVLVGENATLLGLSDTYKSVTSYIVEGKIPTISHTFRIFYLVFDVIVIVSTLLAIYSFWRLRSWRKQLERKFKNNQLVKRMVLSIAIDVFLATVLLCIIFVSGFPFVILMYGLPDITVWVLGLAFVFIARATVKAFITLRR